MRNHAKKCISPKIGTFKGNLSKLRRIDADYEKIELIAIIESKTEALNK